MDATLLLVALWTLIAIVIEAAAIAYTTRKGFDRAVDRAMSKVKSEVLPAALKEMNLGSVDEAFEKALDRAWPKIEAKIIGTEDKPGLIDDVVDVALSHPAVKDLGLAAIDRFAGALSAHARASRAGSAPRRKSGGLLDDVMGIATQFMPQIVPQPNGGGAGLAITPEMLQFARDNPEQAAAMINAYQGGSTPVAALSPPSQSSGVSWGR